MVTKIISRDGASILFDILQGALVRMKSPISIVHFTPNTSEQLIPFDQINMLLRKGDVLFKEDDKEDGWILLPNSGEKEVLALIERIGQDPNVHLTQDVFHFTFTEVNQIDAKLESILKEVESYERSKSENDSPKLIGPWSKGAKNVIKVSIIDDDEIIRDILKRVIGTIDHEDYEIEIQEFEDGLSFEQSDWYYSAHTHLVIIDDVLAKKNEIDIIHFLRNRPNTKKFFIYLLTSRATEDHTINAYTLGVDEVIQKPFNIRLFEALLKRTIERL